MTISWLVWVIKVTKNLKTPWNSLELFGLVEWNFSPVPDIYFPEKGPKLLKKANFSVFWVIEVKEIGQISRDKKCVFKKKKMTHLQIFA